MTVPVNERRIFVPIQDGPALMHSSPGWRFLNPRTMWPHSPGISFFDLCAAIIVFPAICWQIVELSYRQNSIQEVSKMLARILSGRKYIAVDGIKC